MLPGQEGNAERRNRPCRGLVELSTPPGQAWDVQHSQSLFSIRRDQSLESCDPWPHLCLPHLSAELPLCSTAGSSGGPGLLWACQESLGKLRELGVTF